MTRLPLLDPVLVQALRNHQSWMSHLTHYLHACLTFTMRVTVTSEVVRRMLPMTVPSAWTQFPPHWTPRKRPMTMRHLRSTLQTRSIIIDHLQRLLRRMTDTRWLLWAHTKTIQWRVGRALLTCLQMAWIRLPTVNLTATVILIRAILLKLRRVDAFHLHPYLLNVIYWNGKSACLQSINRKQLMYVLSISKKSE